MEAKENGFHIWTMSDAEAGPISKFEFTNRPKNYYVWIYETKNQKCKQLFVMKIQTF